MPSRNVCCILSLGALTDLSQWVSIFFFLSIVRSCEPLLAPSNGAFVGVCNSKYNSVCRIKCNEGYEVSGSAERKCIVVAGPNVMDWSGSPFQCQGEIKTLT